MHESLQIAAAHVRLSTNLLLRFGAPLSAIWMGSILLNILLLRGAVELGLISRFAGLIALAPIILLQLVVFAAMFIILRDGLPLLRRRQSQTKAEVIEAEETSRDGGFFAGALLAVLIPFYGYYAGWGFLSNTLRDYSKLFLDTQNRRIDFLAPDRGPTALEVQSSWWIVAAALLIWLLRRLAKSRHKKTGNRFWPLFIVACETTWALLGLYLISGWQDQLVAWLAQLPSPKELLGFLIPAAGAEVMSPAVRPIDRPPEFQLFQWLSRLFWYSALPLVWFNLGAIIYGHDLNMMTDTTRRMTGGALERWSGLPKPLTDFIGYFWGATVKRWHAVVNGVMLAASAGVALTVSVIVLWRFVDYLGRWAWIGVSQLVGPQDTLVWRLVQQPLNLLFGYPGQTQTGLIVVVAQFCILAAGLELAGRAQQKATSTVTQP
ncbi:hypothetical protein [Manganibacter manganicus]|uniref:Uncharacterized protein n=1 Tax=Manganibacter manganicus TaxID=1873176 RepID=A0A1V8RLV4_9HYPH|nr:hypothetical protein [Pseudaminobacter manganicus]OQM74177.1 hypothetical protein BFN67_22350 [Pseudaminobacter manganicus]